jgi:AcrR family transcriptional regulator
MSHDAALAIEPRTVEILDRVKGIFAAKGFDGASMQDLARAAGMSAGNFYRYFPSKDAIIESLVERDLAELEADFAEIMQARDPRAALVAGIRRRLEDADEDGTLWAEIEAAAHRRPEVGQISARMHGAILQNLVRVFALLSGRPAAEATERHAAEAALIIMLVKGCAVTTCGAPLRPPGLDSGALRAAVLRQIDHILDDIAGQTGANSKA